MTHTRSSPPQITPGRSLRIVRELTLTLLLALLIWAPSPALVLAQGPPADFDFAGMLKTAPGVLGVEAARTQGGKQALFVWFENKQAAVNWVNSDAHQTMMRTFMPGVSSGHKPLADVPDGTGPILVVASLTYAAAPPGGNIKLPVSQIAIELYAPLPGGLAAGGRFAPSSVKVPGLLEGPMQGRE